MKRSDRSIATTLICLSLASCSAPIPEPPEIRNPGPDPIMDRPDVAPIPWTRTREAYERERERQGRD